MLFFNIDFFRFRPRFGSLLGLQLGAKLAILASRPKARCLPRRILSSMSFKSGFLEGSGLDFGGPGLDFEGLGARFWRPQTSSLKPPGSIVGPPAFLWLSFPHSTTQLDQCGTDLLPGVPSFSARAFLKGLANVWEAAVSPLGGLQWNGAKFAILASRN